MGMHQRWPPCCIRRSPHRERICSRSRRGAIYLGFYCFLCRLAVSANDSDEDDKFTIGVFIRPPAGRAQNLQRRAEAVSDPRSPSYGNYYGQEELAEGVGIAPEAASEVASWLSDSFSAIVADKSLANADTATTLHRLTVGSHRDVVIAETKDWLSTYMFGLVAVMASGGNASERGLNASNATLQAAAALVSSTIQPSTTLSAFFPPEQVELILTPGAPYLFCEALADRGQEVCEAAGPCAWLLEASNASNSSSESKGKCVGDSNGLICWPDLPARWRCIDELQFENVTGQLSAASLSEARRLLWKRRHRGVLRDVPDPSNPVKPLKPFEIPARQSDPSADKESRFRVIAAGNRLVLVCASKSPPGSSWKALEFAYVQMAAKHSVLLQSADFVHWHGDLYIAPIGGLATLYQVGQMFVCAAIHELRQAHGCSCNKQGQDQFGRSCSQVYSIHPYDTPSEVVMPSPAESLSALRQDFDYPPGFPPSFADNLQEQAVVECDRQSFGPEDVEDIFLAYGLDPRLLNLSIEGPPMNKTLDFTNAGEGSLDVQVITALAPGFPTTFLGIDPYDMDSFALALLVKLHQDPSPPLVISCSWGEKESAFPQAFVRRLDYELMKLALRGLTILVSSGDNGISSTETECVFSPDLIGSSPWVTTVGATMASMEAAPYCGDRRFSMSQACEERGQRVATTIDGSSITSSGYFSNMRSRPEYQDDVVNDYLSLTGFYSQAGGLNLSTPCCFDKNCSCPLEPFVRAGRASPDIAGPGNNYPVIVNGSVGMMSGTSASAPAVAAAISLLNAEQSRRGEPPLGFLNPWLYQLGNLAPDAFADVTVGDIKSTEKSACPHGFSAAPGWDAATGLGVPRVSALLRNLPRRRLGEVDSGKAAADLASRPSRQQLVKAVVPSAASWQATWLSQSTSGPHSSLLVAFVAMLSPALLLGALCAHPRCLPSLRARASVRWHGRMVDSVIADAGDYYALPGAGVRSGGNSPVT